MTDITCCTECGHPLKTVQTANPQFTCGSPVCQRARKTRLQRERRSISRPARPLPQPRIAPTEAPEDRRYTVIRSQRRKGQEINTVVATDLTWSEATKCSESLQKAEDAAHPERTSWTANLFFRQLQPPAESHMEAA